MKHKLLALLSLFVLMPICTKAQEAPQHRVVYLWDVTYSMFGGYCDMKNSTPTPVIVAGESMQIKYCDKKKNIYNKIMEALIKDIQSQSVESEIIVVPFNDKVLTNCVWKQKGTAMGKEILEKNIRQFKDIAPTGTNLYAPFDYAKNNLFFPKAKYYSELKILTDGVHNEKNPSKADFYRLLLSWCSFAEPNNIKGYYFILAEDAIEDELRITLHDCTCIDLIDHFQGHFENPVNQFTIKGDQLVNLKDQFQQPIKLSVVLNDVERPIQGTEKVHVYTSSNPYFELDETVTIDGKATVEVTLKPKMSLAELQRSMPTDENTVIVLNFDQEKKETPVNELVNKSCELRYVNKPQKTLTISIKQ